eukprot:gene8730-11796_t
MDLFQEFGSHMGIEEDLSIQNYDMEMINSEDCYDNNGAKESTGRWTREEHLSFIKGLELYGKGWKKIAGLIKTRTVVQIRTHAQKYFLKLSKARQNGDSSGSLSMDGKTLNNNLRKKKQKRKYSDYPLAVAPPLQPFLKIDANSDVVPDVDDGLYNFLSPTLVPSIAPPTVSSSSDEFSPTSNPRNKSPYDIKMIPEWYQKGHDVHKLLKEAEGLDWLKDTVEKQVEHDFDFETKSSSSHHDDGHIHDFDAHFLTNIVDVDVEDQFIEEAETFSGGQFDFFPNKSPNKNYHRMEDFPVGLPEDDIFNSTADGLYAAFLPPDNQSKPTLSLLHPAFSNNSPPHEYNSERNVLSPSNQSCQNDGQAGMDMIISPRKDITSGLETHRISSILPCSSVDSHDSNYYNYHPSQMISSTSCEVDCGTPLSPQYFLNNKQQYFQVNNQMYSVDQSCNEHKAQSEYSPAYGYMDGSCHYGLNRPYLDDMNDDFIDIHQYIDIENTDE